MHVKPPDDAYAAPPEFGIEANILQTTTIYLDAARDLVCMEIGGTCVWVQNASDLGANIDVRVNDQLRDPMNISQGFFIRGIPFSRIYVSNTAQAGKWITLFYTAEQEAKTVEISNPSSQFTSITVSKASVLDSLADVALAAGAQTQIVAGNAARRKIIIKNLAANPATLRIGDNGAAAANGHELAPGESIGLAVADAVYAWNPGVVAQSVSVVSTED
jgi:hypothetical protein